MAPPIPAQGLKVVLFGVPDMGKVCAEKHVPSYLQHMDQLRAAGVDKVVCLAVAKPEAIQAWGAKVGIDGNKVVAAPLSWHFDISGTGLHFRADVPADASWRASTALYLQS
jgi:peroxiredoxin